MFLVFSSSRSLGVLGVLEGSESRRSGNAGVDRRAACSIKIALPGEAWAGRKFAGSVEDCLAPPVDPTLFGMALSD